MHFQQGSFRPCFWVQIWLPAKLGGQEEPFVTRAFCRDSTSCPWISTEAEFILDARVTLVLSYLLGCCSIGSLKETALLYLENWRCRVSPRRQESPSVELLIDSAISLLLNLGAARRGRSVLFLDEQKLVFKGWTKGFVMYTKFDLMRR